MLKIVCCCTIKPDCRSASCGFLTDSAACALSFYRSTPLHRSTKTTFIYSIRLTASTETTFIYCDRVTTNTETTIVYSNRVGTSTDGDDMFIK